jgi:hypothetical protein
LQTDVFIEVKKDFGGVIVSKKSGFGTAFGCYWHFISILKTSFVIVSKRRRINKISDERHQISTSQFLAIGIAKDVGVNKVNSCTA